MATLLQTDLAASTGTLHNPLLLAVFGGLHVFRALEQLQESVNPATSRHQPSRNSMFQSSSQRGARELPDLRTGADASDRGRSRHSTATPSTTATISSTSASAPTESDSWMMQLRGAAAIGDVDARALASSHGFASNEKAALAAQLLQQHQHQHHQHIVNWEDLAALHAAALTEAATAWWPRPQTIHRHAVRSQRHRHFRLHPQTQFLAPQQGRPSLLLPVLPSRRTGRGHGGDASGIRHAAGAGGRVDLRGPLLPERQQQPRSEEQVAASPPAWDGWLQAATVCAGAVSRTLAQVAIHPLDTLKTRLQVSLGNTQLQVWRAVMSSAATRPSALLAWAGPAGARDMFLGVGAVLAGTLPASALYFASEHSVRGWLSDALRIDREAAPCRLAASAAAATLSALVRVPADVVKHRVQAYAYPSAAVAARDILAARGPAGLYAGFGATLLRDAPDIVIQFTVYRQLKALLERSQDRKAAAAAAAGQPCRCPSGGAGGPACGMVEHLVLGGAAGAAAALATTPLDVVKTQLQCGAASSVGSAVAQVVRAGGPVALFGGLAPRLLQTTLCSAIFFTCFEASKARLGELAGAAPPQAAVAPQAPPLGAAAREAAAALKLTPHCWQPPPPPPAAQQGQRRSRRVSGGSGSGGGAAAGPELWEVRGDASPLAPVAVYAYAYAGAAVPSATVPFPLGMEA